MESPGVIRVPSPKSQNLLVIVPVELSVKLTIKGFNPLVGVALKFVIASDGQSPPFILGIC